MALAFVLRDDTRQNPAWSPGSAVTGGSTRTAPRPQDPSVQARTQVDVLVVDDDAAIRSSCADMLRESGHSVAVAEDGEVALRLLGELEVGMVLLDLRMPRMDGVALLEAVDTCPPVVLHSAFSLDKQTQIRIGSKVRAHLQKPVSPYYLLQVVSETLQLGR